MHFRAAELKIFVFLLCIFFLIVIGGNNLVHSNATTPEESHSSPKDAIPTTGSDNLTNETPKTNKRSLLHKLPSPTQKMNNKSKIRKHPVNLKTKTSNNESKSLWRIVTANKSANNVSQNTVNNITEDATPDTIESNKSDDDNEFLTLLKAPVETETESNAANEASHKPASSQSSLQTTSSTQTTSNVDSDESPTQTNLTSHVEHVGSTSSSVPSPSIPSSSVPKQISLLNASSLGLSSVNLSSKTNREILQSPVVIHPTNIRSLPSLSSNISSTDNSSDHVVFTPVTDSPVTSEPTFHSEPPPHEPEPSSTPTSTDPAPRPSTESSGAISNLHTTSESKEPHALDCSDDTSWSPNSTIPNDSTCHQPDSDPLSCFQDPIFCERYFESGKREIERPVYGEYEILGHEKWFQVIQHGGVAFLYHPCIDASSLAQLRNLVQSCLHRYVLTPYNKLARDKPIALVTWGCYLLQKPEIDVEGSKTWIKLNAFKGPSSHVHTSGQYSGNIVKEADVVTDRMDTILCPNKTEVRLFYENLAPKEVITKVPSYRPTSRVGEQIIKARKHELKHKRDKIVVSTNITLTQVNSSNAVWAVSSLLFICGTLLGLMYYTRLWHPTKVSQHTSHAYNRVSTNDDEFEYDVPNTEFSLLKSSQRFVSIFKPQSKGSQQQSKKQQQHKLTSITQVRKMSRIAELAEDIEAFEDTEEEEDEINDEKVLFIKKQ